MILTQKDLIKDITKVDTDDILSCWLWTLSNMKSVITISTIGDIFLLGQDDAIYWLQTDFGDLTKIADSLSQFDQYLKDTDKVDNWFLPLLIEKLILAGKTLKEKEVYSFKKPPILGGDYSVDNLDPTDMSVHFAFSGQICQQAKNLPPGIKINLKYKP